MLKGKKHANEETAWDRFMWSCKTQTFSLIHELLQTQPTPAWLYMILIVIESIQLLWYSVHSNYAFLWNSPSGAVFQDAIKYLQFDAFLHLSTSGAFFTAALYAAFGLQVFVVLLFLGLLLSRATKLKKKGSTFLTYTLKVLGLYMVVNNTILGIPFLNVFYSALYCQDDDKIHDSITCYSGIYWLHLAIGVIGLVLFLGVTLLVQTLFIERNPFSSIPFSSPLTRIDLLKLVFKIALPLYIVLDYQANYTKYFIGFLLLGWAIFLILRYNSSCYHDPRVHYLTVSCESIIVWFALGSCFHAFLGFDESNPLGLLYLFVGAPVVAITYCKFFTWGRERILRRDLRKMKRESEIEYFILEVMQLIENREKPRQRIELEGILKLYIRYGPVKNDNEDICQLLMRDVLREEDINAKTRQWYLFVKIMLSEALDRLPKSRGLHMLYSHIQHEKLTNKYKALTELMIIETYKPGLQEEFLLYRYAHIIEEEMIEEDTRNSESKGMDINTMVLYQNKFIEFVNDIEKSVEFHLEFWRELLEELPDIKKLQNLGTRLTNQAESSTLKYQQLMAINPNNIKTLQVYGNFLKDIVNDEQQGNSILEKAEFIEKNSKINKQFVDEERLKYGENATTCIITCSGNINELGIVKNCNSEISRILQFTKNELIGHNITKVMPKVYADRHQQFMLDYFDTAQPKVMSRERLIFPINRSNFIKPCTLYIKVLPNLDEGIKVVGFIKDIDLGDDSELPEEQTHYILYGEHDGVIYGITSGCQHRYGIPATLVYGNVKENQPMTIDEIFPDLAAQSLEELKSTSGVIVTLDTTKIPQDYMVGRNKNNNDEESEYSNLEKDEEEREQEENLELERYRRLKVRAIIEGEEIYDGVVLKILKFSEYTDTEIKKERSKVKEEEETKEAVKPEDVTVQHHSRHHDDEDERDSVKEGSDRASSVSANTINDEVRQVREGKAAISEKTEPKSIKCLRRSVMALLASVVIISSVELAFRFLQNNSVEEGINGIYTSYNRTDILVDVLFYTRQLQMLATGTLDATASNTSEASIRANLIQLINNLQDVQFQVIKDLNSMESRSGVNETTMYNISSLQQDNSIILTPTLFSDAYFQFITAASAVRNSSLLTFAGALQQQSTVKNFYFVMQNGLNEIRIASDNQSNVFYNFYHDDLSYFNIRLAILMAIGIGIIVLFLVLLIPIVFSVLRTNNRVLSLFGYIPINEINALADKCDRYRYVWLEKQAQRNYYDDDEEEGSEEYDEEEGDEEAEVSSSVYQDGEKSYQEGNPENSMQNVNASVNTEGEGVADRMDKYKQTAGSMQASTPTRLIVPTDNKFGKLSPREPRNVANKKGAMKKGKKSPREIEKSQMDKSAEEMISMKKSGDTSMRVKTENTPLRSTQNLNTSLELKKKVLLKKPSQDEEDNKDNAHDRSQKLLNSKDNSRWKVVFQFIVVGLLLAAYFVIDYCLEVAYISDTRILYDMLQLISMRTSALKFTHTFTQEDIVNKVKLADANGTDLENYYNKLVYANEQILFEAFSNYMPPQFSDFRTYWDSYNLNNTCQTYYASSSDCKAVASGTLEKGMKQAVIYSLETDTDSLNRFFQSNLTTAAIKEAINSQAFINTTQVIQTVDPVMKNLNVLFLQNAFDFLDYHMMAEKIKFSIYIVFVAFVFAFIWSPYLNRLSQEIWRTKGMLSMIPIDIMTRNENLKSAFLANDFLFAVK